MSLKLYRIPLPPKHRDLGCAYLIEVLDLLASIFWLVGSFFFLPSLLHTESEYIFLRGASLYVGGCAVFCSICIFTFLESIHRAGILTFEAWENGIYFWGSALWLIGTLFYWPIGALYDGMLLFLTGSIFFALAAFCNALNQRAYETLLQKMFLVSTSFYMIGSLMFVAGSICFMPNVDNEEHQLEKSGSVAFIAGCAFCIVGSLVNMLRISGENRLLLEFAS